jgi:UDPglucose--hexose-1-phosphate uridylyltransferase
MPEIRQNIITRDWVIIASERAARPDDFKRPHELVTLPRYESSCPFCPGNEHLTGQELLRIDKESAWQVRVVPNRYPALAPEGERIRTVKGICRSMTGVGIHEVIVEHPRHDIVPALYDDSHFADVLATFRERYAAARRDPRVEAIIIFSNHGEAAGTSLQHPHSQITATPVVPSQIRTRIDEATRYFDDNGDCLFCRTLREELMSGERIIVEGADFVAFHPFAALSPFHTWIFPRRHMSSFEETTDTELLGLASVLRKTLAKLYYGLNDPDYNYTIRSTPTDLAATEYFHWYLSIVPRVLRTAGFELGSGMFINPSVPEESAAFLRSVKVS